MFYRTLLICLVAAFPATADPAVDMPLNPETGKPFPAPVIPLDSPSYLWVASEGYRPLKSPKAGAAPSGAEPLAFMDTCRCAFRWQADREYLLLAKGTPGDNFRLLGWVDINLCVLKETALTTADEIARKAMIVNTARTLAEAAQLKQSGKAFFEVPILRAPNPGAPPVSKDPFRLFNIYFVYGDSEPADPDGGYLLLGKSHEFSRSRAQDEPDYARTIVLGWVPKHRICRWDTREAVEFNTDPERRHPAEIYKTRADAETALKEREEVRAGRKQPVIETLLQEDFPGGRPAVRPYDEMRFPLIPIKQDQRITTAEGGELQLVGFVGHYLDESGKPLLNKEDISRLRKMLDRIDGELGVTEIMFVVDFTASMEPHVLATAETIDAIIKSVQKQAQSGSTRAAVKVGLALYSDLDTDKRRKLDDTVRVLSLTAIDPGKPVYEQPIGAWLKEMRDKAKAHQLDEGGDLREQMLHGLKRGIEKAGFTRYARKVVVVIGDYGSHRQTDKDEEEIANLLAPLSTDPETKKIVVEKSPVDFFAFQVKDPKKEPANDDLAAFPAQVNKIIDLYDAALARVNLKDTTRRGYAVSVDPEELSKLLLQRYDSLRREGVAVRAEIDKLQRGQLGDVKIGPELQKILQREGDKIGVDVEHFVKSAGMQVFHFGYIWDMSEPKVRQTRLKYLVSKADLEPVLSSLQPLISSDYEQFEKRETSDTFTRLLVSTIVGEDPARSLGARLKARGLRSQSPLLQRSLDPKAVKFDLPSRQDLEDIRLRVMRLEDAVNERISNYQPVAKRTAADEKLIKWEKAGESKGTPRRFNLYGNERDSFYWIDFEKEWP